MKMKKIISLVLAATLVLGLCACGKKEENQPANNNQADATTNEDQNDDNGDVVDEKPESEMTYGELSSKVYNEALGNFYKEYQVALESAKTVSERYALMAVAEAKLMEAGVMFLTHSKGGTYGMVRYGYRTSDYQMWGNDDARFYKKVVTNEPVKKADYDALKALYAELCGTGTYNEKAAEYLTSHGYTLKDTFNTQYSSDPQTWDVLASSRSADSEAIVNCYDGLMEYDCEGVLQPAIAESYDISDDGLTYTFHLRKGVAWTDSQGRNIGEVKADDFVAGFQHIFDTQGGLGDLVCGKIVNATEYNSGEISDFAQVGVEAIDDYTVAYHLETPVPFFPTMLGYGTFAPLNREYYVSQGGKFGAEFDASDSNYVYGTDPDHIAYCGPYLVTSYTKGNSVIYEANPSYWNKDAVRIKKITWSFNDGSDPLRTYNDFKAGIVDSVTVNNSVLELCKSDGLFEDYVFVSDTDATSYVGFFNINRAVYANTNDESAVVSPKSEEDRARAYKAMRNQHFRLALIMAIDRGTYNAQQYGENLKYTNLINAYIPGTFVKLDEDVTISINGTNTSFPAGTMYGAIRQAQIEADGIKINTFDPTLDSGMGSSSGYDGWYNPTEAMNELQKAIAELDMDISADNPIYIDDPCFTGNELSLNKANALKQSVEAATNGAIVVNIVEATTYDEVLAAGYYTNLGSEANFDIYDMSGWGPDYGDPSTYLDTMLPDYAGYMVRNLGVF